MAGKLAAALPEYLPDHAANNAIEDEGLLGFEGKKFEQLKELYLSKSVSMQPATPFRQRELETFQRLSSLNCLL